MNKEDTKKIIETIVVAYPNFLEVKSPHATPKAKLDLWIRKLSEMDYKKTKRNLERHIDHSPFEPKIADIKPEESSIPYFSGDIKDLMK